MPLTFTAAEPDIKYDMGAWLTPLCLIVILLITVKFNFLLFHTLAEFFTIIVATLASLVAWKTYPFTRNNFLMYLGCGYFWVGCLDLCHTLSYQGLTILPESGPNLSTQFWLSARFLEAFVLLSTAWFLTHSLNRWLAFLSFGLVSFIFIISIQSHWFPVGYIQNVGLTPFKRISEYVIIAALLLAIILFWHYRHLLDKTMYRLLVLAIAVTAAAELCFTFYVNIYDISNIAGHILKLISFWLVFVATIRLTLEKPFQAMSRGASTYDAIPVATILVDTDNTIRQANHAAAELAKMPVYEMIGQHCHSFFHPKLLDIDRCDICIATEAGTVLNNYELKLDSSNRWRSYSLSPTEDNMGSRGMVQTIRDITREKLAELQIQQNKDRLEGLVTERTDELQSVNLELESFCHNITQNLQGPLRSINGFSQALMEDYQKVLDKTAHDYLLRIQRGSSTMGVMIDDLLELSSISKSNLKIVNINISQQCQQILSGLQANHPERKVRVKIQADIIAQGDPRLINIVLTNILDNAWKFTSRQANACIELGTEVIENQVVYYIRDNGVGFKMQYAKRLFGAFQRLHSKDDFEGNGIGLATAHRIVRRHGGHIWAKSEPEQGATFYFTLAA